VSSCVPITCTQKILFESGADNKDLLARSAPIFFGDLNSILNRIVILSVCAITDPAETQGHKNLTVSFFVQYGDKIVDINDRSRISALRDGLHAFRQKLLPARNKLIGHLDRGAALGKESLGAAPVEDWNSFWSNLRDFLQILDKVYIDPDGLFNIEDIGMISDADSLLGRLWLADKAR
jgi:hypothetical protein